MWSAWHLLAVVVPTDQLNTYLLAFTTCSQHMYLNAHTHAFTLVSALTKAIVKQTSDATPTAGETNQPSCIYDLYTCGSAKTCSMLLIGPYGNSPPSITSSQWAVGYWENLHMM